MPDETDPLENLDLDGIERRARAEKAGLKSEVDVSPDEILLLCTCIRELQEDVRYWIMRSASLTDRCL